MQDVRRVTRRLAMQVLYWIDMTSSAQVEPTAEQVLERLDAELTAELADQPGKDREPPEGQPGGVSTTEVRPDAVELALAAWHGRASADAAVSKLSPAWPTHRQPAVDRAILRLGHHEITSGRTPWKVAVNEAVELAKRFGGEQSPSFVNGVLDKIGKASAPAAPPPLPEGKPGLAADGSAPPDADAWLADAVGSEPAD
jgi:N utilization substance protein B